MKKYIFMTIMSIAFVMHVQAGFDFDGQEDNQEWVFCPMCKKVYSENHGTFFNPVSNPNHLNRSNCKECIRAKILLATKTKKNWLSKL